MDIKEIMAYDKKYHMNTFGDRIPVCFVKGEGIKLYSTDNTAYTDFFAGIAVSCLGHGNKTFINAVKNQLDKVVHTSNYYYIENQSLLAKALVEKSFADKAFFSNSGAEANEAAIKLARAYYKKQNYNHKYKVISLKNSFHGRTLATVAATGTEKYQEAFLPMPEGFLKAEPGNIGDVQRLADDTVCAVMIEPLMGEGGVIPHTIEYMQSLRNLCDEKNILLIIDAVQTGIGRTGEMFGYEHYQIQPDIMTLAKGLGGGLPIGACLATEKIANSFQPGDHGSTYSGNPLVCAGALAVLEEIENKQLIENAGLVGSIFKEQLNILKEKYCFIDEIRGMGLMLGMKLSDSHSANKVKELCFDHKYLIGIAGQNTVRFLPPLIITREDVTAFIQTLDTVLGSM